MLNEKGQEFSVFKLLISAIVAIVILTLLLQILNVINIGVTTEPDKAAEDLLKSMDASPYQEKVSDRIDFEKEHSISAAALASKVGLGQDQICLGVEDGLDGFDNSTETLITYTRDASARVNLAGICGPKDDFDNNLIETSTSRLSGIGFSFSQCSGVCNEDQRCCVLVVVRSSE